jgi:hypothetical protein
MRVESEGDIYRFIIDFQRRASLYKEPRKGMRIVPTINNTPEISGILNLKEISSDLLNEVERFINFQLLP